MNPLFDKAAQITIRLIDGATPIVNILTFIPQRINYTIFGIKHHGIVRIPCPYCNRESLLGYDDYLKVKDYLMLDIITHSPCNMFKFSCSYCHGPFSFNEDITQYFSGR